MTHNIYYKAELIATPEIISYLVKKDSIFSTFVEKYGIVKYEKNNNIYESIVSNIIGQQLSNKVKQIIYERFLHLVGDVIPENIVSSKDEDIRDCGISYSKIKYIKELSLNLLNENLNLSNLDLLSDEELIKFFQGIKGIGRWTAEMLALFTLGRQNIISYDDVAIRNGIMKAKQYKTLSIKRFEGLRKKYSPYCSYASLYFYAHNDEQLRWK